jgi:hypothetical protein
MPPNFPYRRLRVLRTNSFGELSLVRPFDCLLEVDFPRLSEPLQDHPQE